ncbi:Uncharacterized protein conserved in bacteria (DUF2313) [Sebaldella termitidis]|uniref:DUF2313 domain-containing protein n=2 Tax=Sebaldella TaxID=32068 RepID=D1AHS5_SEBTE|nr:putative phage tail protein [Sebaldella termitidis]ACZ08309.1 hypothetical protein Sterm_1447 [Sebaldella termitidis ATCC 33386]SUI23618.1 Uncharacterized protein conserved in bacteria (DUF2313) [Sebaldella termitidis]
MIFEMEHIVKLIEYLPQFMADRKEMQVITSAEEPEFTLFWAVLKRVINNQFITTCDEQGISKFEKMLKLYPYESDTLEMRIARVLVEWNAQLPYTMRSLKQMLDVLCGAGNYRVKLKNNEYVLEINTFFYDSKMLTQLNKLLLKVLPANLAYDSTNYIVEEAKQDYYLGAAAMSSMHYVLSSDFTGNYELSGSGNLTGSIIQGKKYVLGG